MNSEKIGKLILRLRMEQGLTQRQLGAAINVSDKAISRWECGNGVPDISIVTSLAAFFNISVEDLLAGKLTQNDFASGNLRKSKYYVCGSCNNIVLGTGTATVSCCGRNLAQLVPQKPEAGHELKIALIEDEWFITCAEHEMLKEHYISFLALVYGDRLQLVKLFPEWDMQVRLPKQGRALLLWYCTQHGLFFQYI